MLELFRIERRIHAIARRERDRRARLARARRHLRRRVHDALTSRTALGTAAGAGFLYERWAGNRRASDGAAKRPRAAGLMMSALRLALPGLVSVLLGAGKVGGQGHAPDAG